MDEHTLMAYRRLCVEEPAQTSLLELPLLTASERSVFEGLITGRWGPRLRLEQERIPWDYALGRIRTATTYRWGRWRAANIRRVVIACFEGSI